MRGRVTGKGVLAAALLLSASPLFTADFAVAQATSPAAIFESIRDDLAEGRYAEARARVDEALARAPRGDAIRELQKMRGSILLWEGRREDAMAAFAAAETVAPASPNVALYQFDLAFERHDAELAVAAIEHLVDRYPEAARTLPDERVAAIVGWMRANDHSRQSDDLVLRLTRLGFGGNDVTVRDNFAIEAVGGSLAGDRLEEAREMAARVNSRRELAIALTERRFSAIWPDLEARIGPHMNGAETAFIRDAEAIAARKPDDVGAQNGLMQAYYLAGRLADADRVGRAFASTDEAMRQIGEKGGWLVNNHALVLHAMGREADADARFAAMRVIDITQSRWLISMVINRLELLVADRHWDQALRLQDEAAQLAEQHGSPYARQLVRRLRLCTFHGLGRTAEVEAALAEVRAHGHDAPGATVDGLICVGRIDEAETVLVQALGEQRPGVIGQAIEALQPSTATRTTDPSIWTEGWQQLLERPSVRREFDRVGRVLPEAFWPETHAAE